MLLLVRGQLSAGRAVPRLLVCTGNLPFQTVFTALDFDGDGLDDQGDQQVIIIQSSQPAPSTEPSAPAENRIYVQPHWVDGGYGVQVLQPGYWTTPKKAD